MDEFEQKNFKNEANDSHNTFYQNAIHNKERENVLIKKLLSVAYFPCVC